MGQPTAHDIPQVMLVEYSTRPDGNCRDGTRVQDTATQKKTPIKPGAYIRAEGPSENCVEEEESSDPSAIALPEILKEQRNDPVATLATPTMVNWV